MKFVTACWPVTWLLRKCKFDAIFMPWKTVYVLNDSEEMRAHELIHAEQVDRDGAIKFSINWLWWTITKGYWENDYEIEAYANMHRHLK